MHAALREAGHEPVDVAWDDPEASVDGLDVLAIRSSWNYHERPEEFLRWIDAAAARTTLVNGASIVRWNIHKRYLLSLAEAGVPVVPTRLTPRGREPAGDVLGGMDLRHGCVVKPAIGAGSAGVRRFAPEEIGGAAWWIRDLSSRVDVLVQPYLHGFQDPGERSLIWIDSAWTHAIRKRPRFAGEHERVDASEDPTDREIGVARQALAAAPAGCRYARVDLVRDAEGRPAVSELELIEPSLYFVQSPDALARFVAMLEKNGADTSRSPGRLGDRARV
ncbi:MAG TPA: hypothetical protein VHC70_14005 [Phycisphaerales bacterium]|nr:hypothetical protein [Phycisphaerales bacterium]